MLDEAVRAYIRAARLLHNSKGELRDLQVQLQRATEILSNERWTGVQLVDRDEPLFDCCDQYEMFDLADWPTRERIAEVYLGAHVNYEAARAAWARVSQEDHRLVRGPNPRLTA